LNIQDPVQTLIECGLTHLQEIKQEFPSSKITKKDLVKMYGTWQMPDYLRKNLHFQKLQGKDLIASTWSKHANVTLFNNQNTINHSQPVTQSNEEETLEVKLKNLNLLF